jgi:phosphatidylethanolamine-binding protein (PEBP) family uncharacterized protein
MTSATASTLHRIALAITGVALVTTPLAGYSGTTAPLLTAVGRTIPQAPGDPLTIGSPAFADGDQIPTQYTCKGANIAPPLVWSTPLGGALVVDDLDAVAKPYIHWIVTGIAAGPGATADGQSPAGGTALPNSAGHDAYTGPCPPAGTGVHRYRFTLYQLPATLQLPPGLAGPGAVQAITRAATAQAEFTGTFENATATGG